MVPFMNETCPENFKVRFEEAKATVAKPETNLSNFRSFLLYFKHIIQSHIISTTLISRKGSLSNVTTRDVFIMY